MKSSITSILSLFFFFFTIPCLSNTLAQIETISFDFENGVPPNWNLTGDWFVEGGQLQLVVDTNDCSLLGEVITEAFNFSAYDSIGISIPQVYCDPNNNAQLFVGLYVSTNGGQTFTFVDNIYDNGNLTEIDLSNFVAGESNVVIRLYAEGTDPDKDLNFKIPTVDLDEKRKKYDIDTADRGQRGGYNPQQFIDCYPIGEEDTMYVSFSNSFNNETAISIMQLDLMMDTFDLSYNLPSYNYGEIVVNIFNFSTNQLTAGPFPLDDYLLFSAGYLAAGEYIELTVPIEFTFDGSFTPTTSDVGLIHGLTIGVSYLESGNAEYYSDDFKIQVGNCCENTSVLYSNESLLPLTSVSGSITAQNATVRTYASTTPPTAYGVEFKAGTYVDLLPGFGVEDGAIFYANVDDCTMDNTNFNTQGTIDLAISLVALPHPSLPNTYICSFVIANFGTATATGVQAQFAKPPNTLIVSFTPNVTGTTYDAATGIWDIPNIPPNSNASIDIFIESNVQGMPLTNFGQIIAANEGDIDSTPNNSNGMVNEDDEGQAIITLP